MHLRKKLKIKLINVITILIIALILSIVLFIEFISIKIYPSLLEFAKIETQKINTLVINKAISKQLTTSLNEEDFFTTSKTSDGNIIAVDYNTITVNKILTVTTNLIQLQLKEISEGNLESIELFPLNSYMNYNNGLILELPISIATSNPLLSNIGPKIPIKIQPSGIVETNLTTNITNYGINSALLEVYISVTITQKIILPLLTESITTTGQIPITLKVIQGTVPNYYSNGISTNSSLLSVPIE